MNFEKIRPIFEKSFPPNERRTTEGQIALLKREKYTIKVCEDKDFVKGFVCFFDFDKFIFLEHLAVNENCRGQGIGSTLIREMQQKNKDLILEVELPNKNDINTIRRINFYESLDFHLSDYDYYQPPLSVKYGNTPMKIMSYKEPLGKNEFDEIRKILYKEVYNTII